MSMTDCRKDLQPACSSDALAHIRTLLASERTLLQACCNIIGWRSAVGGTAG